MKFPDDEKQQTRDPGESMHIVMHECLIDQRFGYIGLKEREGCGRESNSNNQKKRDRVRSYERRETPVSAPGRWRIGGRRV